MDDYKFGDLIAVVQTHPSGTPELGVFIDQTRRTSAVTLSHAISPRIPTRGERPDLEFLDEKTPILSYGELR